MRRIMPVLLQISIGSQVRGAKTSISSSQKLIASERSSSSKRSRGDLSG